VDGSEVLTSVAMAFCLPAWCLVQTVFLLMLIEPEDRVDVSPKCWLTFGVIPQRAELFIESSRLRLFHIAVPPAEDAQQSTINVKI
jgi:hypothetical protein